MAVVESVCFGERLFVAAFDDDDGGLGPRWSSVSGRWFEPDPGAVAGREKRITLKIQVRVPDYTLMRDGRDVLIWSGIGPTDGHVERYPPGSSEATVSPAMCVELPRALPAFL